MKELSSYHYLLLFVLSILLFFSCKQPETVVVEEGPKTAADTAEAKDEPPREFQKLVMGEYHAINTLDPLFADNAGSMRAVQLLYEGLVRFNEQGEIIPAVAESWKVSDDSLTYRFMLRSDIYFHESNAFSAGAGRKLKGSDIKYVFERMAKNTVPPKAAQLFMSIDGFDPYYQEQRNLFNPVERELQGINGIQVPNDTTVVFNLIRKDEQFMEKLATPLAVIYPREAEVNSPQEFKPVGTGPYRFSQKNNNTYIFSRNDEYYDASQINLNRIDIRLFANESNLFKEFASGNIHLLPQLGPQVIEAVTGEDGTISSSYAGRFRLDTHAGQTQYTLRYNTKSELPESLAKSLTDIVYSDSVTFFQELPDQYIEKNASVDSETELTLTEYNRPVYAVYSEDPFIRMFYKDLSDILSSKTLELQMVKIRTPSHNTGIFFTTEYPIMNARQDLSYPELVSFSIRHITLRQKEITNLPFNEYPWWINLRSTDLPQTTTQK